jgi:hypothetical protein
MVIRFLTIFRILNKKFWEELIAYFPSYDTYNIEKDASNNSSIVGRVFVTAVTFLPSRCLATINFTEPLPTDDKGTFTEPLPSNDKREIHIHTDSNVIISLLYIFQNRKVG